MRYVAFSPQKGFLWGQTCLGADWLSRFLRKEGYYALWAIGLRSKHHGPYPWLRLAGFFQDLHRLIEMGVSLTEALQTVARRLRDKGLRAACEEWIFRLQERGEHFFNILEEYPQWIPRMIAIQIRLGEQTAALAQACANAAAYAQLRHHHQQQLLKIQSYVGMVLVFVLGAFLSLLFGVIPLVRDMYVEHTDRLPWVTQKMLSGSAYVSHWQWTEVSAFMLAAAGLIQGMRYVWRWNKSYYTHLIHSYFSKIKWVRLQNRFYFWSALSHFLEASVPLLVGLNSANRLPEVDPKPIHTLQQELQEGHAFSDALAHTVLADPIILQMIRSGESTGHLAQASTWIAKYLYEEICRMQERWLGWLQPLGLLVIAGLMLGVIYTLFLPLYEIYEVAS